MSRPWHTRKGQKTRLGFQVRSVWELSARKKGGTDGGGGKSWAGWPSWRWNTEDGMDAGTDTFWRRAVAFDGLSSCRLGIPPCLQGKGRAVDCQHHPANPHLGYRGLLSSVVMCQQAAHVSDNLGDPRALRWCILQSFYRGIFS